MCTVLFEQSRDRPQRHTFVGTPLGVTLMFIHIDLDLWIIKVGYELETRFSIIRFFLHEVALIALFIDQEPGQMRINYTTLASNIGIPLVMFLEQ